MTYRYSRSISRGGCLLDVDLRELYDILYSRSICSVHAECQYTSTATCSVAGDISITAPPNVNLWPKSVLESDRPRSRTCRAKSRSETLPSSQPTGRRKRSTCAPNEFTQHQYRASEVSRPYLSSSSRSCDGSVRDVIRARDCFTALSIPSESTQNYRRRIPRRLRPYSRHYHDSFVSWDRPSMQSPTRLHPVNVSTLLGESWPAILDAVSVASIDPETVLVAVTEFCHQLPIRRAVTPGATRRVKSITGRLYKPHRLTRAVFNAQILCAVIASARGDHGYCDVPILVTQDSSPAYLETLLLSSHHVANALCLRFSGRSRHVCRDQSPVLRPPFTHTLSTRWPLMTLHRSVQCPAPRAMPVRRFFAVGRVTFPSRACPRTSA
ncbi:hypothetical protein EXIGLDRAFT_212890 [Exidia glandulosa HHB12029]|uniref:Uncharacterized protein n=1 Tax=Exidia glandulosa HHB12029 TaxID=1314781 RepID=A0A165EHV0_EXIGL|nr:hypothetical protein EXIGLDRAFT_212890 [Exidia glandulosa HHB12029]